jgi:formylglycine-generating enzyme
VLFLVLLAFVATPLHAISVDVVPVGNPGNGSDINGRGSVAYPYQIGKTEVTIGQYTAFLNAVAVDDVYSLYETWMASDLKIAGISRSGSPGSYSYSVIASANKPIAYVTWADAARFANWLHNGQPTGAQNSSTTEDGAYTLNGAVTFDTVRLIKRNENARWFIPSENEWYKAAYHKNDGVTNNYWDFPTGTDSIPNSDQPLGDPSIQTNVANFSRNDFIDNGFNDGFAMSGSNSYNSTFNYLSDVAAYSNSPSPYGTFDQGGNLVEWSDTIISLSEWDEGSYRSIHGGSWSEGWEELAVGYELQSRPTNDSNTLGFRVAMIPEPDSGVIAISAAMGVGAFFRKRRSSKLIANKRIGERF